MNMPARGQAVCAMVKALGEAKAKEFFDYSLKEESLTDGKYFSKWVCQNTGNVIVLRIDDTNNQCSPVFIDILERAV